MNFWKDKKNKFIKPDLFSTDAENLAKKVAEDGTRTCNKRSQIRKFYDEVLNFSARVGKDPIEFEKMLPYLKMLNAKAAYAKGRGLISDSFKNFLSSSLQQVNDKDDFEVFTGFFEAFMGYYRLYRPSE
ncbi:MAG: type III-A CRISPR-associated protein Csm2 [Bacteroidetes bacterium]|nr:type III-A CRISPR-associated protein Csm2 [Bacteroidota bacterium]